MEKLDDASRMINALICAADAIPQFTLAPRQVRVFFDTILGLPQLWFAFEIRQGEPPLIVQMISPRRDSSTLIIRVNEAIEKACESIQ